MLPRTRFEKLGRRLPRRNPPKSGVCRHNATTNSDWRIPHNPAAIARSFNQRNGEIKCALTSLGNESSKKGVTNSLSKLSGFYFWTRGWWLAWRGLLYITCLISFLVVLSTLSFFSVTLYWSLAQAVCDTWISRPLSCCFFVFSSRWCWGGRGVIRRLLRPRLPLLLQIIIPLQRTIWCTITRPALPSFGVIGTTSPVQIQPMDL